ncbi:MAG: hypothetical protein ABI700_29560, partial [Chloroflexota bacterium]
DIYVPAGATDFGAQIFTLTGETQTETGSEHIALTAGQWNHVSFALSPLGDLHDMRALGVKIGTNFTVFDGTFSIDKIVFSDTPEVKFQFKEVAGMTAALSDLKPGSYTVELWDTQAGTIISSTSVESSDGTVQIALPGFNTDLAIKVKAA